LLKPLGHRVSPKNENTKYQEMDIEVGDAISGRQSVNLIGQERNSVKERNGPDWRLRCRRQILDEDFFRLARFDRISRAILIARKFDVAQTPPSLQRPIKK
jgi:hypothetical protein